MRLAATLGAKIEAASPIEEIPDGRTKGRVPFEELVVSTLAALGTQSKSQLVKSTGVKATAIGYKLKQMKAKGLIVPVNGKKWGLPR